jgi:3-oxoacyl-[acyl-carrier protein] reductase
VSALIGRCWRYTSGHTFRPEVPKESDLELDGKVALVTGAGRAGKGIGRSICLALAKQGASIAVADFVPEAADSVAEEVRQLGMEAISLQVNVSNTQDVERMVELVVDKFGRIDILVNNAGITRDQLLMRMSEADWDAVLDTNLKGTFNCTRAVAKLMMRARSGKIVNIASVMGIIGNPGQANYSASKAGVIGLTKTVAKELGSRGVNVNAIAPGFIETAMTEELSQQVRDGISTRIPLERLGVSDDVANAVVFLCSDASSYVTGQVINVDGGMVM